MIKMRHSAYGALLITGLLLLSALLRNAGAAPEPRLFELRTYTSPAGKLDHLHRRFREHTLKLFEKHGMQNIAYWVPEDRENTIVYVLAHDSREAATASWKAFGADPEWQRVRAASEANGPIVTKVESVFLRATDYSPMR